MLFEVAVGSAGEDSGECGVFEVGGLVHPFLVGVGESPERSGGVLGLLRGDEVEDVP